MTIIYLLTAGLKRGSTNALFVIDYCTRWILFTVFLPFLPFSMENIIKISPHKD